MLFPVARFPSIMAEYHSIVYMLKDKENQIQIAFSLSFSILKIIMLLFRPSCNTSEPTCALLKDSLSGQGKTVATLADFN